MTSPYREGKPLADIIPPDRRRQRTIALLVGGMIAGAIAIEAARGAFSSDEPVTPPPPRPPIALNGDAKPGPLTAAEISAVVADRGAELRTTCFRSGRSDRVVVDVDVVISAAGEVESATARGDEPSVTACVEEAVKVWRFPRHLEPTPKTRIPIRFERT